MRIILHTFSTAFWTLIHSKWTENPILIAIYCFVFQISGDAGERELIVASEPIYIETSNHDDPDFQNDSDLFCPASPTTVPVSAIKSRSNSGMHFQLFVILLYRCNAIWKREKNSLCESSRAQFNNNCLHLSILQVHYVHRDNVDNAPHR